MTHHHTCTECGCDDLLADIQVFGYVCHYCDHAQALAAFIDSCTPRACSKGYPGMQPWQVLVMSRWLRTNQLSTTRRFAR